MSGKRRFFLLAAALALLAAVLAAAAARRGRDEIFERQLFAMDTVMTLTASGPHAREALEEAALELERLDALWSTGRADSEVSRLNARAGDARLSADTAALLERALEICRQTGGLFDPSIYPLTELWGFQTDEPHVPAQEQIEALLPLVDGGSLAVSNGALSLGEGQSVDLGGIAKGFASARVMEIFRKHGVSSGMVSLGGNVQTLGAKPDGSAWRVGIRDPEGGAGDYLGVLSVRDKAVITSGGYERFFEEDGQTYCHILDPRSGYPASSDLASATAVSADGVLADGLSTALYIMGSRDAAGFWAGRSGEFDMVLVTVSGEVLVTEGIAGQFECRGSVSVLRSSGNGY